MKPLYSNRAHFCSPYGPLLFQTLIVRMGNGGEWFRIMYNIIIIFIYSFVVQLPLGVSSYFSLLRSSVNGRKIRWNPGGVT